MKTTTVMVANAIRKGIEANFAPENQAAKLEEFSELFLDLAASIEMDDIEPATGLATSRQMARYANVLGEIGWSLDRPAKTEEAKAKKEAVS